MPPVFIGVFFHWLGGLASGSFYVPYKFVKNWSWEVYWLAGGFVSWIFAPWILAFLLSDNLVSTIYATLQVDPKAILYSFLFGMMWGVGGLTFGLTMRYLGMSLGMAVALGYCTVLGTLMPPLVTGEFMTKILGTHAGWINLFGLGVCALGITLAGLAGMSKEREMSEEAKKESIKEFNFFKGILVATVSGIFSAGMAYGMAAADPIATTSQFFGTKELWTGLPKLCVILLGGFTSNFIWCAYLLLTKRTTGQFFYSKIEVQSDDGEQGKKVVYAPMVTNYFFSALAGLTWYMQFFFYSMGETCMQDFKFSSWTLHMASIIIFSSLWGIALHEWKGTSKFTKILLAVGIGTLLYSTLVVGYSNYMNASAGDIKTNIIPIAKADQIAGKDVMVAELTSVQQLNQKNFDRETMIRKQNDEQQKAIDKKAAKDLAELEKRYPEQAKINAEKAAKEKALKAKQDK